MVLKGGQMIILIINLISAMFCPQYRFHMSYQLPFCLSVQLSAKRFYSNSVVFLYDISCQFVIPSSCQLNILTLWYLLSAWILCMISAVSQLSAKHSRHSLSQGALAMKAVTSAVILAGELVPFPVMVYHHNFKAAYFPLPPTEWCT